MRSNEEKYNLFDSGFSVFDTVLYEVSASVGSQPVETGGALLGDYASGVISAFVFDDNAETTSASYIPSRQLAARVGAREASSRVQFKGILHSHPGAFDSPSGPDAESFRIGLAENPELPRYLAPIVTFVEGPDRDNKMELPGGGWISFYVARRNGRSGVQIDRTMPDIIFFGRDCIWLANGLNLSQPTFVNSHNGDNVVVSAIIGLTPDLELILTADGTYPTNPPVALLHDCRMAVTQQIDLRWSLEAPTHMRLARSLSESKHTHSGAVGTDDQISFGLRGTALTSDQLLASTLGLTPTITGSAYKEHVGKVERGLFARSRGLLSETLQFTRVAVAGAGSVGSYVAEQLVRSGVGHLSLIDPDTVDYPNLSRTNFSADDVGDLKIHALARRLLSISPSVNLSLSPQNLHDLTTSELDALALESDLVVCALDDRRAQLLINHFAYHFGKPAIFIGIFQGARSGEVVYVEPSLPCFDCATSFRRSISTDGERSTDYGTGQLAAEIALGTDIQSISSVGVRMALSRLVRGTGSSLASFVDNISTRQYAIFGVDPEVAILNEVMGDISGQYGYRSIWFSVQPNQDCVVCGNQRSIPQGTPSIDVASIQEALHKTSPDLPPPRPTIDQEIPPL